MIGIVSRSSCLALVTALTAACGTAPPASRTPAQSRALPPQLPDTTWGTHVLAVARSTDRLWTGTYGRGIFFLPLDSANWQRLTARRGDTTAISWDFVNSFGLPADSSIWYGTVGNGFGRSTDRGRTWRNWGFDQLGPEWQYVAADGIRTRGDTVLIATADGLRITWDGGNRWRCVQAAIRVSGGSPERPDGCTERISALPTEYLLSLDIAPNGNVWVGHLFGLSVSENMGRTWRDLSTTDGVPRARVRAIATDSTEVWFATERDIYRRVSEDSAFRRVDLNLPGWPALPGAPRALVRSPGTPWPAIATSFGMAAADALGTYRIHYLAAGEIYRPAADIWDVTWWGPPLWPIAASATGIARILAGEQVSGVRNMPVALQTPRDPVHALFERPIHDEDGNPHIDATYRYGSTMGGNFQQHQGVEFNNPAGTPVRAVGAGVVAYAGAAEAGAQTIAILHDARVEGRYLYSVYYHNSALNVQRGQRVAAGDVIARVGNTGRATNDHLHLEIHFAPTRDSAAIVNPQQRFPPHTVNPQLWIRPLPGTGIVAGRVRNAQGQLVPGARIYGLVLPYPEETPYSFAETYRERAHVTPGYDENFAVGDIPAGTYLLGVEIDEQRVWRRVRVEANRVTFVEFAPDVR